MAYRVELTRRAEEDALEAADHIAQDSRAVAANWFRGLEQAVASLGEAPGSFSAIVESLGLNHAYRSLRHHAHRVIYRVDETTRTVYVVRIYHGARRPLRAEDLRE